MDNDTLGLIQQLISLQNKEKENSSTLLENLKAALELPLDSPAAIRAHTAAKERKALLDSLTSPLLQSEEKARLKHSKEGMIRWFKYWAQTADPRPDAPLYSVPFIPFDFQNEGLLWLWDLVFEKKKDGLVEKSRDLGLSWLVCGFAVYNWLFASKTRPFTAHFGSKKEDAVDKRGDMSSLFEKMRFLILSLPEWMLPIGFNPQQHMTYMRIINPQTGSAITGESSNDNFGRSGRNTMVVFDEFAVFPGGGYSAWTAASQSTRTRLAISTPYGMGNKFAELRHTPSTEIKTFHWRLHPFKDDAWYEREKLRMSAAEIAQELEIDYQGSLPGRLFPMYSELHHVITWSEFANTIGEEAQSRNRESGAIRYHIPKHWKLGMAMDVGTSIQHPNVCIWSATASEDSPLCGSVFLYRQFVVPEGAYPGLVAPVIKELMAEDDEQERMALMLMSHEAASERLAYNFEHELQFTSWKTDLGYSQGIAQIQDYLALDNKQPHPFRSGVVGRPRLYIIVDDEEGKLIHSDAGITVTQPISDKGFRRLREEIPRYHIPESEYGKPARQQRPFKLFDDAIDCVRALAAQLFPSIQELSESQRLEKKLPANFRSEKIKDTLISGGVGAVHAFEDYLRQARREMESEESFSYYQIGL